MARPKVENLFTDPLADAMSESREVSEELLNFQMAAARHAPPAKVRDCIAVCFANKTAWAVLRPLLSRGTVHGSKRMDVGAAMPLIEEWDSKNGGRIAAYGLNREELWFEVKKVIGWAYKQKRGGFIDGILPSVREMPDQE